MLTSLHNLTGCSGADSAPVHRRIAAGVYAEYAAENRNGQAERVAFNLSREKLGHIRDGLHRMDSGLAMLQEIERDLAAFGDNLIQMRILAAKVANTPDDTEQHTRWQAEFEALKTQNTQIAESTVYEGKPCHRDGQTIAIFADALREISWTTRQLPVLRADLLDDPEALHHSIEEANSDVIAYRDSVLKVLAEVRQHCQQYYEQSDALLEDRMRVNNTQDARSLTGFTAAEILQANRSILDCQSGCVALSATLYG